MHLIKWEWKLRVSKLTEEVGELSKIIRIS